MTKRFKNIKQIKQKFKIKNTKFKSLNNLTALQENIILFSCGTIVLGLFIVVLLLTEF